MIHRFASIRKCLRMALTLMLMAGLLPVAAQELEQTQAQSAALVIPANIHTRNVPPLPVSVFERLQRYADARSAALVGWQGDQLLIVTRFADTSQLHRVHKPLGYRQQLTFLREPLGGITLPRGGAKDQVILRWDVGGSEFDQLFLFDLNSGTSRILTDGESLHSAVIWAPDEQSFVYATTQRNGRNWDIHWQDLLGNSKALLETQAGTWYPVDWSRDGKRLLVQYRVSVNESAVYELNIASAELTPLLGTREPVAIGAVRYDGRGGVYFTSDANSEFLRLHHLDLASGAIAVLTEDVAWNIEGFSISADYSKLVYATNVHGTSTLTLWGLPQRRPIPIPDIPPGVVLSASFSPDSSKLAITVNSATAPSDVHVVDIQRHRLTRWTRSEAGGLNPSAFVQPDLITYVSFDGLEVPAFIYRPDTPGPHPVLVLIHGGPEAQYRPYFSASVQAYVNQLNVAVIAPNVRGSNGYGKTYLELDNGRLRENAVRDIGALLDWIEEQADLNSERVAVMGGSYGGYMVLAAMVHYGDRLTAAVESVGISNFVTFLQNTQPYRQDLRRVEYGDERDPEMRRFLQDISPLTHVDKMVTPLLIVQGANDPRVPASESEQIFNALEAVGVPVWYILATDEGHGFAKKENRDYDRAARFVFLESHLHQQQQISDE